MDLQLEGSCTQLAAESACLDELQSSQGEEQQPSHQDASEAYKLYFHIFHNDPKVPSVP